MNSSELCFYFTHHQGDDILKDLSWEEWCWNYPAEKVNQEPEVHYGIFELRSDAEMCVENLANEEYPLTAKVVDFNSKYYVISI